jgi:peptidoglycan/xylan/chitin deacetylase (PgdA/CDA1 family)
MEDFKWQMQYLKDNGFNPISMKQLMDYWFQGKPLPLKPVLISFDDGFRTIYRDAFSTVKEFKYPTVLFLYTQFIENEEAALKRAQTKKAKKRAVKKAVEALSVADIQEMQKEGMDVQSHTANHLQLGLEQEKRPLEDFKQLVEDEFGEPVTYIESNFGHKPTALAYPYGVYDPLILKKAKDAGYVLAFTVNPGPNDRTVPPLKLRRNLILYPISHASFEKIFADKVLHLERAYPGDGQVIKEDKPTVTALIKDEVEPKSIKLLLGNQKLTPQYDPVTREIRHRLKSPLKAGGHMLTLEAKDKAGQPRVYTWYFRIKHKNLEKKETGEE